MMSSSYSLSLTSSFILGFLSSKNHCFYWLFLFLLLSIHLAVINSNIHNNIHNNIYNNFHNNFHKNVYNNVHNNVNDNYDNKYSLRVTRSPRHYSQHIRHSNSDNGNYPQYLPKGSSMEELLALANFRRINSKDPTLPLVLTMAISNYRDIAGIWITHMKALGYDNYIVLCFQESMFQSIDPGHALLLQYEQDSPFAQWNAMVDNNSSTPLSRITRKQKRIESLMSGPTSDDRQAIGLSSRNGDVMQGLGYAGLLLAKYVAITTILNAKLSVVWSDLDAIWVKPCVLNFLRDLVSFDNANRTDIASQQGLHPYDISRRTGACLCAGFFLVNSSPQALYLIESVQSKLLTFMASRSPRMNCDQTILNREVFRMGGFRFNTTNGDEWSISIRVYILPNEYFPRNTTGSLVSQLNISSACIWHRISDKIEKSKIKRMISDGIRLQY